MHDDTWLEFLKLMRELLPNPDVHAYSKSPPFYRLRMCLMPVIGCHFPRLAAIRFGGFGGLGICFPSHTCTALLFFGALLSSSQGSTSTLYREKQKKQKRRCWEDGDFDVFRKAGVTMHLDEADVMPLLSTSEE